MSNLLDLDSLKYPIGKFKANETLFESDYMVWISKIADFPKQLIHETMNLSDDQLDTPYREGGWTIRQVVHHLADSHLNSYCRFKLALTEDLPSIRPYFEDRWAELPDGKSAPIRASLNMLESLHSRWVYLLTNMKSSDWKRKFHHPESKRDYSLKIILALYAWHGEHHLQHIIRLKQRMNWLKSL